jgi:hypothetical protein
MILLLVQIHHSEVCFEPTVGCYYEDEKEFREEDPFINNKSNTVCVN